MKNAFLERQRRAQDEAMHIAERVTRQYEMDCWQIALARYEKLDLGYQRIMEITALQEEVRREYSGAIMRDNEQDRFRVHKAAHASDPL